MVNTVYFDPAVGGNGLTVTDDGNPTTGLDNDGHRARFVPALAQVVAVASNTVTKAVEAAASAETASNWATKTDGPVSGGEYSAKYHALAASTSATNAASSASAASTSASNAASSAASASSSASAANTSAGNASTSATNAASSASAASTSASNAASSASNAASSSILANDWAVKISGPVAGGEYSAKYHALAAEDSREQTQGYAETIIAVTNIDFGGFSIVDGELLTTYVDLGNSVPSIVDGEFVITY